MEQLYLGVDLGGTNIAAGIVTENGDILCKNSMRTELPKTEAEIEANIFKLCKELCEKNGYNLTIDFKAVGVGTPGSVNSKEGTIGFNANFGYKDWQLKKKLEELFKLPVFVENDANTAIIAEVKSGSAKGCKNAVIVTLGTGIGSGIVIDGKVFSGSNYSGGEMGHIVIVFDGRECKCGRKGCFERYASASALTRDTKIAMEKDKSSMLWQLCPDINKANAKISFEAMRMGDKTAKMLVDQYIQYLGCGIINIINTFQPEIICLGGGISNEKDDLLTPLKAIMDKEEYAKNMVKRTKLTTAKFKNDAGIIGAALLSVENA